MPDLTGELNLALATDDDDQADYLDLDTGPSLRTSLRTIDGLFNTSTGHTHNGAHQGGLVGSIPASAIPDGGITAPKLAANAVTTIAIIDGAVTSAKIADGTIVAADIADGAITSLKIADRTIQSADIAVGAVSTAEIADRTIQSGDIAVGAVTSTEIADRTIQSGDIAVGAITSTELADGGIQTIDLADGCVSSAKIPTGVALTSPALSGSISGQPAWTQPQAFPSGTQVAGNAPVTGPTATPHHLERGILSFPSASGARTQAAVFIRPFSAAPQVFLTQDASFAPWLTNPPVVASPGITTTGFTAGVQTPAAQPVTVMWMAYGPD